MCGRRCAIGLAMNRHLTVAIVSALLGVVALALALFVASEPVSLGTALGVVLLANAAVRWGMARQ